MAEYQSEIIATPTSVRESQMPSFLIYSLDPEDIIEEFTKNLKGFERNDKGEWVKSDKYEQYLTDQGIANLATLLSAVLNKNNVLSQLEEPYINDTTTKIGETVLEYLYLNWDRIVIKDINQEIDISKLSIIYHKVIDNVYPVLRRALHGFEAKNIRQIYRASDTVRDSDRQQKQGLLSSINIFNRKQPIQGEPR